MTEEEHIAANEFVDNLIDQLRKIVDKRLKGIKPELAEYIRTKLQEDMRFWHYGR